MNMSLRLISRSQSNPVSHVSRNRPSPVGFDGKKALKLVQDLLFIETNVRRLNMPVRSRFSFNHNQA